MSDERVDPELARQLDAASPASSIGAVFMLRSEGDVLSEAETTSLASRVMKAASKVSGSSPESFQIFTNVQSFSVLGTRALVEAVIAQPEVASAVANLQAEDALIKPLNRRQVTLESSVRAKRKR